MRARIEQFTMGYHVRLFTGPGFELMYEQFKSIVPRGNRRFNPDRQWWFVDLRAKRKVEKFIAALTNAGGKVESV